MMPVWLVKDAKYKDVSQEVEAEDPMAALMQCLPIWGWGPALDPSMFEVTSRVKLENPHTWVVRRMPDDGKRYLFRLRWEEEGDGAAAEV